MKKIISLVLVVFLMASLSVSSFAFTVTDVNNPLVTIEDDDLHIGTLITSGLTEPQRLHMLEWLSSDYGLCFYNPNTEQLNFCIVRENFDDFDIQASGKQVYLVAKTGKNVPFHTLSFRKDGTRSTYSTAGKFLPKSSDSSAYYLLGSSFINKIRSDLKTKLNATNTIDYLNMVITDDDGLLQPTDPDPEEPPPTGGGEVVIPPADGVYVTYDTSAWSRIFLPFVKQSIGSSTNAGLSILAIIMGILVVIMIVRKFSRTS